ncbi:hypothetical protein COLO4_02438 [Corchorus olitorius]|uniref:Uncharacterized protein n=1 Tax=Corchorus olitorius TaxID=93759 RepID=A0A1R3L110_9ROSI|nr:hypothetical protein COLO4_02438 [Corchorus olitorius]
MAPSGRNRMPTATSVWARWAPDAPDSAIGSPREVPRELVGHPAAARAALQRPDQRGRTGRLDGRGRHAERGQPLRDDGEVFVLAEGVEAHPEAEALGQRDLLFHDLARMHLAVRRMRVTEVFLHVFRQQVPAVAGRIDQHVGRRGGHGAVQDGFQRLVAGLALLEAQVVAVDDEFLGTAGHHLDDVGQVGEVGLVHLDEAQPLAGIGLQAGLDEGGLAGAARAREQHVVGRAALDELPAPGHGGVPVGCGKRPGQHRLDAVDELLGALQEVVEAIVHGMNRVQER